jgi:NADH-quinone oxidoreductase subunit E
MSIDEKTYGELREIAARYPQARSGLLPMLHLVQSAEGSVTPAGIDACAEVLGLTAAEVSAVATFYTMYKRHRVGDFHVGVCTNTLCAVMGGDAIHQRLTEHLGDGTEPLIPGEIAEKRQGDQYTVSVERVECNAACDYAPVVMVNWEFLDNQTPDGIVRTVEALRAGHPVASTRGPKICTWRQAERVLAGFDDGLADEGPTAGPASLVGLELARDQGWTPAGAGTGAKGDGDA